MENLINDCKDCKDCTRKCPSFSVLSESELDALNDTRTEVKFKKGEIIYKQGTPLSHLVIVHSGYGKIYMESSKGRNLILCYTRPYDLNGGVGIFIDKRHHSSLMAVTDCGACFIDINAFNTVLQSNQAFREAYLKEHSKRVLHIYNQFTVLTQKNMEGRMAESILYLGDQIFNNGSITYISKQDLADLTAMTRESAIRVLKGFKEEGLIDLVDHTINILDKKALEQITLYA